MPEYRIGRLRGGFVVTWKDDRTGTRRRYRLDALTVKGAEAEALDVIRRETVPLGTATVATIWEAYRQHLGQRPAATALGYTGRSVLPHFGALRPDQIEVSHSRSYAALRKKAGLKAGTTWTELGHLRSSLTWAVKVGLIPRAPYIERPQKPAPKDRWLTHAEIDQLLAADAEPHVRLATLLMLTTAGRVSAVLDLTWDRVDLERGQINLRVDQEGPRKGRAVVPINATLRAALTVAKEAAMSDYVIEWAGGRVASIKKGFMAMVGRSGLQGVSQHVLRHTAGVHMVEAGIPMSAVAQYLGHSSTAVTERVYGRFSPQFLQSAADVLDFGKVRSVK